MHTADTCNDITVPHSQLAITFDGNTQFTSGQNSNCCLCEHIIDFCLYLWLSDSDHSLEVRVYGPFYWALHHCSYVSLVLKVPVVPDVVLWLVVFSGEIASGALAWDFDHGELFTIAGEITRCLAWTGIPSVLLLLRCNTKETAIQQSQFQCWFVGNHSTREAYKSLV